MIIEFIIHGTPVAQGRPRACRVGNGVRMFDPEKSRDWKRTVMMQALQYKPKELITGAIDMHLNFYLPRPKSLPKKIVEHTKKPDIDNLCKGIKDGLKGVIYHDDSQVVFLTASKVYAGDDGPKVSVTIITDKEKPLN